MAASDEWLLDTSILVDVLRGYKPSRELNIKHFVTAHGEAS